jgi:catechol 2,3-dioxygenase-like lactoylglutathione lyase family enzyme
MRMIGPVRRALLPVLALGALGLATPLTAQVTDAAPGPLKLSPFMVGLSVGNLDLVTRWYVEKLGFKVTLEVPLGNAGGRLRWIEADAQRIELMYLPDAKSGPVRALPPAHAGVHGFTHLTMEVPDLDAAIASLAARGVTPAIGPVPVAPLGVKVLFLRDPEGNMVELLQRTAK